MESYIVALLYYYIGVHGPADSAPARAIPASRPWQPSMAGRNGMTGDGKNLVNLDIVDVNVA